MKKVRATYRRSAGVVWAGGVVFGALLGMQATLRLIRCGPDVR